MNDLLRGWLNEQLRSRFHELPGATASFHVPIADGVVSRLIAASLPRNGRIRELSVRALDGDVLKLRVRLAGPALLPAIYVQLRIVEQPRFPQSPVLILRLVSQGLALLAGNALRLFNALPPGITVRDDLVQIDLRALAHQHGFADTLSLLAGLRLSTTAGQLVVDLDVATPVAARGSAVDESA